MSSRYSNKKKIDNSSGNDQLPPIQQMENNQIEFEQVESYSFKKNLLSPRHYDHINAQTEKTMVKRGLGRDFYLSDDRKARTEMSPEFKPRYHKKDFRAFSPDDSLQRKLIESSRTIVNSRMTSQSYASEVQNTADKYNIDIESANSFIIQKSKLQKEMIKKLDDYKTLNKYKQLKSSHEHAIRSTYPNIIKDVEAKIAQFKRQYEQRVKFEYDEEVALIIKQYQRQQKHLSSSNIEDVQFESLVRNEEMINHNNQTDSQFQAGKEVGLGINMLNNKYNQKVEDFQLNDLVTETLVTTCDSVMSKDKIKDHIIQQFDGINRSVLNQMKTQVDQTKQIIDTISVEVDQLENEVEEKQKELYLLKNKKINGLLQKQESLKLGNKEHKIEKIASFHSNTVKFDNLSSIEETPQQADQNKLIGVENRVNHDSLVLDQNLSTQYEKMILDSNISADKKEEWETQTVLGMQTLRIILMKMDIKDEDKAIAITHLIEQFKPFFNLQFSIKKVLQVNENTCKLLVWDSISQEYLNLTLYNSNDQMKDWLFNFESNILHTMAKNSKMCSCILQGVDSGSKVNQRIQDTLDGQPLEEILNEIKKEQEILEKELFNCIFQLKLEEIDVDQLSEFFLHDLIIGICAKNQLNFDQMMFLKKVVQRIIRILDSYMVGDYESDNSSVEDDFNCKSTLKIVPEDNNNENENEDIGVDIHYHESNRKQTDQFSNDDQNYSHNEKKESKQEDEKYDYDDKHNQEDYSKKKLKLDLKRNLRMKTLGLSTELNLMNKRLTKMYHEDSRPESKEQFKSNNVRKNFNLSKSDCDNAANLLMNKSITEYDSYNNILRNLISKHNPYHFFNCKYNLSSLQRETIDNFKSEIDYLEKIEELMMKLIKNYNQRTNIASVLLKDISDLLTNCFTSNISNVIISTNHIQIGNVKEDKNGNESQSSKLFIRMPQWKMSINDNMNNTLLVTETRMNELRKINEIEKIISYGNFDECQQRKQLPDQQDPQEKLKGLQDSKQTREIISICKIVFDIIGETESTLTLNDVLYRGPVSRIKAILLQVLHGIDYSNERPDPIFSLVSFSNMVNDPKYLGNTALIPLQLLFKQLARELYFNRYEEIQDLVDDIKFNMEHGQTYRDVQLGTPMHSMIGGNMLMARLETELMKGQYKGHSFLHYKFSGSFPSQYDMLQSLLQHVIPKDIYRLRIICKFYAMKLLDINNTLNSYKLEKQVRGPSKNQTNIKSIEKATIVLNPLVYLTRLFYGMCTLYSNMEKHGQIPSMTRELSWYLHDDVDDKEFLLIDISGLAFRNYFEYWDVYYQQDMNRHRDQVLMSTALSISKLLYYTLGIERLSDLVNLIQGEEKRSSITMGVHVQTEKEQSQRDNLYIFVICCLYGRQILKNGCLVDYTELLECFDNHLQAEKNNKKFMRKRRDKKASHVKTVKDRLKKESYSYLVVEDEQDSRNTRRKSMYAEVNNTRRQVTKDRTTSAAFEFKSQTGIELRGLREIDFDPDMIDPSTSKGPKLFIDNQPDDLIKGMCLKKNWDKINIKQIATCDEIVVLPKIMLIGESKTGKTMFAKKIVNGFTENKYVESDNVESTKFIGLYKGVEMNLEIIDSPENKFKEWIDSQNISNTIIFFYNKSEDHDENIKNFNEWIGMMIEKNKNKMHGIVLNIEKEKDENISKFNEKDWSNLSLENFQCKPHGISLSINDGQKLNLLLSEILEDYYPETLKDLEHLQNKIINFEDEEEDQ